MIEIKWMNRTALALSMGLVFAGQAYAQDQDVVLQDEESVSAATDVASDYNESVESVSDAVEEAASDVPVLSNADGVSPAGPVATTTVDTTSMAAEATPSMQAKDASDALQQQEGDATRETNLEEVFSVSDERYSLVKKGSYNATYDLNYSYYQDQQLDLALDDSTSTLTRLRIENVATHNVTNTFTVQYGLLDNFTLTASLPLVAKSDNVKDTTTAGLGDLSFGARWEPFPLKQGRLPLILFGTLSTKTGDSPYEINAEKDLSTGKGYYSVGAGASTRKYIDPVVLFASASANYGFKESGLNQARGSRVLESFEPGVSGGFSFGFAYSFNYDVSLAMSYQQSLNMGAKYTFKPVGSNPAETSKPADQSSATLDISLGIRVSPKTIVNGSVGIGLTEDAPDVSLGLSFPLDFLGFGRDVK